MRNAVAAVNISKSSSGSLTLIQGKLNKPAPTDTPEFRQWQKVFEELAELVGLTLVVYDKDAHLLGTCRTNPICEGMQLNEAGSRLCDRDCGGMLEQMSRGSEMATFKCHASLYNFAMPIRVEGQVRFVLLGGRVFRSYQDFSSFAKIAPQYFIKDYFFEDWSNTSRFEDSRYFERTAHFIQSMVDSFSRESSQIDRVKKKSFRLNTLYDLSSVLAGESSPDKIFHLILQALGVLFDIQAGAVFRATSDGGFEKRMTLGALLNSVFEIRLGGQPGFEELQNGQPNLTNETYQILRTGFPETVRSVHSFPVLYRGHLTWILQIYNTVLDAETIEMLQAYCRHVSLILENVLMKQESQENTNLLSVVTDFNISIGSELETQGLYQAILLKTADILGAEQGSLMIYDENSNELSIKFVKGLNEKIVQNLRLKPGEGIAGFVFETGRSLLVKNVDDDPRFEPRQRARYKTKSLMSIPLKINNRKIGVLNVTDKSTGEPFSEDDLRLLESIASHASVALDRTDFYKKSEDLRKISITDSLTDLYNRRFFQERMVEEIERARRHSLAFSLIMLDIDNFKSYNDTYGHLAGDEALRMVSVAIKNSVRNIDRVARYGGEEFAVILPMTEIHAARDIAERIRSGVAGRYFPDESLRMAVKLTVSIGIASFPQHADSMLDLIGNADKALYLAKVTGKNRVALFDKDRSMKGASGRLGTHF